MKIIPILLFINYKVRIANYLSSSVSINTVIPQRKAMIHWARSFKFKRHTSKLMFRMTQARPNKSTSRYNISDHKFRRIYIYMRT